MLWRIPSTRLPSRASAEWGSKKREHCKLEVNCASASTKYYFSCTEAFSRTSKLHLVDRGLRAYRSGIPSADQPDASKTSEGAVYKWAVDTLCEVLNSTIEVLPQDAGAVVQIMDTYEDERLWKR